MKPAPFKYHAPESLERALEYVAQYGYDAKVLAGGQSLIPTMNFRLAQPAVLIDLNKVEELFYIRPQRSTLNIGAMTRKREVERSKAVLEKAPLVYETMPHIGHVQIRNLGTIGGSIAHADPASELPAVMLALNARFRIKSTKKERWEMAKDFFVGAFTTTLEPDELLVEIEIPKQPKHTGCCFQEVSRRKGDYALVGVAATVTLDRKGKCQQANLVFMSVGEKPVEAVLAQQALSGQTAEGIENAVQIAAEKDIDPSGDIHASADYRCNLAKTLAERALKEAFSRAKDN